MKRKESISVMADLDQFEIRLGIKTRIFLVLMECLEMPTRLRLRTQVEQLANMCVKQDVQLQWTPRYLNFMVGYQSDKKIFHHYPLHKKCLYSELFWSAFSCIRTDYGEIRSISSYSVRMRENADQNNSEHEYFLRSDRHSENQLSS